MKTASARQALVNGPDQPVAVAPLRFAPDLRALLIVALVTLGAFLPWSAVRVPAVLALLLLLPGWAVLRLLVLPSAARSRPASATWRP
jgi:hypothetical protein